MLDNNSILYHYCSVDAFYNILKTHSLWLTHAREMNDALEDIYFRKPLSKALQTFNEKSESEKRLIQTIVDSYMQRINFPYVTCFSQDNDMLSQWRAYADDGRGVVIGFDLGAMPHVDLMMEQHGERNSLPVMIDEVSYTNEDNEVEFMRKILSACLLNYEKSGNETMVTVQGINALNKLSIFAKSEDFAEEHEVRLVYYPHYRDLVANLNGEVPNGNDLSNIQFRVKDGRIISYFTYAFPIEAVKSITLGPKCAVDYAQLTLFLGKFAPQVRINGEIHKSKIAYR